MGSDCGPDLANLFLFAYEYRYVMNLIDTGDSLNYSKFRRFLTVRRIIEFVQPICLPFEDDANEKYKDSKFIVAGWGYTIADIEWKYNSTYFSDFKILSHNIIIQLFSHTAFTCKNVYFRHGKCASRVAKTCC